MSHLPTSPHPRTRWICISALLLLVAASGVATAQGRGGPPPCPTDLAVSADNDGNHLTWDHFDLEGEFHIYRANAAGFSHTEGTEGYTKVGTVDDDVHSFTDSNVEAGTTYRYVVTFDDGVESYFGSIEECGVVEVTAVPFFGMLLGTLAMAGVVAAYVVFRRR